SALLGSHSPAIIQKAYVPGTVTACSREHRDGDPLQCAGRQLDEGSPSLALVQRAAADFNNSIERWAIVLYFADDRKPARFRHDIAVSEENVKLFEIPLPCVAEGDSKRSGHRE